MEAPFQIKFSQGAVSALADEGKITLEQLEESMRTGGWKGAPIDIVERTDGSRVSLDNRRLLAAQRARLSEIPVAYHTPNEAFPPARANVKEFTLGANIRRLEDGTLVKGGTKGDIVYRKGFKPTTYEEAALVRTANQTNVAEGQRFLLFGRFEQPRVGPPPPPPASGGRGGAELSPTQSNARALAAAAAGRGSVIVNIGGAGAPGEPAGAINVNNMAVPRKDIPNLVVADGSDVGTLFEAGTIDRIEGHNMAPGSIDWGRAAPGAHKILKHGGTFEFYYRGANTDAAAGGDALKKAGFKDVEVIGKVLIRANKR
jgi:hypothetical protein